MFGLEDEQVIDVNSDIVFESPAVDSGPFELCKIDPLPAGQGFFELRPYQHECVTSIYGELNKHQSTLVVMATGLGKTVAAIAEVALRWPDHLGRVLVIAHTEELIDQAAEKIGIHLDEATGIEMGERRESNHPGLYGQVSKVLVASIQTLSIKKRRERIDPKSIGIIIYDEAHHSVSKSARKVFEYFLQGNPQIRIVGPTATPKRADKKALGDLYQSVAYEMYMPEAIREGWLVDIEQKIVIVEGLDFSQCRKTADDMNREDLAKLMMGGNSEIIETNGELTELQLSQIEQQEKMVHAVVKPAIEEACGRPSLVFCVTKAHARLMCDIFNRYIPGSADLITDETSKDDRKDILTRFRAGQFQFLCNVNVLSEGYDSYVDVIVNAAPTKSIARYIQRVGRGTRTVPGLVDKYFTAEERLAAILASKKPCCTVLDFTGDAARHDICTVVDVLGGEYEEDVISAALAKLGQGSTEIVTDLLEETKEELERERIKKRLEKEERERQERERAEREREQRRLEAERRKQVTADVAYRTESVGLNGNAIPEQVGVGMLRGGASDSQVKYLMRLGVSQEQACKYTKGQAGAVIDSLSSATGKDFRVRFGKYLGHKLGDLPGGYISWAEKNMTDATMLQNIKLMKESANG